MNERKLLYKICKQAEKYFDVICYAYKDGLFWNICIDDYDKYQSQEFKNFSSDWHNEIRTVGLTIKIVFCYCYPLEDKLSSLAIEDNLILLY